MLSQKPAAERDRRVCAKKAEASFGTFCHGCLLPGKQRLLVDKAQTIAPWILGVKGNFTPGPFDHFTSSLSVYVLLSQTAQGLSTFVNGLKIRDREIDVIGNGLRFEISSGDVNQREDHLAAVKIMPRAARY